MNHLDTIKDLRVITFSLTAERAIELKEKLTPVAERIEAFTREAMNPVILNNDDAERAVARSNAIKDDIELVKTILREPEEANKLHKAWVALRDRFLVPLTDAGKAERAKIKTYQDAEFERAERERCRLQMEEEYKVRKEKEELLAKAEKVKSEKRRAELVQQADSLQAITIMTDVKSFIKTRGNWKVKSVDKMKMLIACVANPQIYSGYVQIDESALRKAKIANNELELEGVVFEKETV